MYNQIYPSVTDLLAMLNKADTRIPPKSLKITRSVPGAIYQGAAAIVTSYGELDRNLRVITRNNRLPSFSRKLRQYFTV